MSLETLPIPTGADEWSAPVGRFVAEAEARMAAFVSGPTPVARGFVPSDFPTVYSMLAGIERDGLAPGPRFLEWGSGFGVVAGLAAALGFEAYGIEIRDELVDEAQALVEVCEYDVSFGRGTFVPESAGHLAEEFGEYAWWSEARESGYDEIGLDLEDFDFVYAYPWPGEEELVEAVFDDGASDGALLLTYHGVAGAQLRRKR